MNVKGFVITVWFNKFQTIFLSSFLTLIFSGYGYYDETVHTLQRFPIRIPHLHNLFLPVLGIYDLALWTCFKICANFFFTEMAMIACK